MKDFDYTHVAMINEILENVDDFKKPYVDLDKCKRLIARQVSRNIPYTGPVLSAEDLIIAAICEDGLMRALENYDPSQKVSFHIFAEKYVFGAIRKEIDRCGHTFAMKAWAEKELTQIQRLNEMYQAKEPDLEKRLLLIAAEFNKNRKKALPLATIRDILLFDVQRTSPVYLDEPVCEGSDESRREMIPDSSISPEEVVINKEMKSRLERLFHFLPEKEREIVKLRMGWDDCIPKTNREVGEMLGLSAARIGQLYRPAMEKFKAMANEEGHFALPHFSSGMNMVASVPPQSRFL